MLPNAQPIPAWMQNLVGMYKSAQAHAFILHFNVRDYAVNTTPLTEYLFSVFAKKKVLLRYNLAEGITFALPSMRDDFDRYTDNGSAGADPTASTLAAMGLASAPTNAPADKPQLPKAPAQALALLETLLQKGVDVDDETNSLNGQAIVILEFAETVCPTADVSIMSPADRQVLVTLERWGADKRIADTGNIILLITENVNDLHPALRRAASKFEQIEIPMPDYNARRDFIRAEIQSRELELETGLTEDSFAAETAMLNRIHIEDICLRGVENDNIITRDLIRQRKDTIIAGEFGEVIEMLDPVFGFDDIGGLEHVKDFFNRSVIRPIREQRYNRVPMGVLMTGPAGTGKTIMARAVAKESGINCVLLNPAKIFGQFVGNTERNLDRALRAIQAMSPVLVFIDEIDQSVSRGGGGDSGVSNRVFKRLLEFMSDTTHRGKVVFLAATNRPDMIDAALRRPGRFDKKIPFLVPDATERANILHVMAKRYGLGEFKLKANSAALTQTENWTGAELEAATVKAVELMEDEDLGPQEALTEALKRFRPSTADIEYMTLIAVRECNDTDLLPPKYKVQMQDRNALEQKIAALEPKGRSARTL